MTVLFRNLFLSVKVLVAALYDPMDCSPPGSSVRGILQSRILAWVACPPPGDLTEPGIQHRFPALQADSLSFEPRVLALLCKDLYLVS